MWLSGASVSQIHPKQSTIHHQTRYVRHDPSSGPGDKALNPRGQGSAVPLPHSGRTGSRKIGTLRLSLQFASVFCFHSCLGRLAHCSTLLYPPPPSPKLWWCRVANALPSRTLCAVQCCAAVHRQVLYTCAFQGHGLSAVRGTNCLLRWVVHAVQCWAMWAVCPC